MTPKQDIFKSTDKIKDLIENWDMKSYSRLKKSVQKELDKIDEKALKMAIMYSEKKGK